LTCINSGSSAVGILSAPMTPLPKDQRFVEGVLGNVRLFADVLPGDLTALARQSRVLEARRGETISRRAERMPGLFIVGYGLVKLALRTVEQRERVWRIVSAGQCFGAPASLLGRASRYEASAVADAKLIVVPSAPVLALMEREARFGRSMVFMLAEHAFDLLAEYEAVTLLRSSQRLASYLESLAEPAAAGGRPTARLPVSKTLVAARLGMKKETLSRLLRKLTAEGLIEVSRRDIAILDPDALARLNGVPIQA
jgi:CRP-like cAMP-binding protein